MSWRRDAVVTTRVFEGDSTTSLVSWAGQAALDEVGVAVRGEMWGEGRTEAEEGEGVTKRK